MHASCSSSIWLFPPPQPPPPPPLTPTTKDSSSTSKAPQRCHRVGHYCVYQIPSFPLVKLQQRLYCRVQHRGKCAFLSTLLFSFYLTLASFCWWWCSKTKSKVKGHFFFHPSSSTHYKRKNSTTHFFQGCQGGQVSERCFVFWAKFRHLATPKKKGGRGCES